MWMVVIFLICHHLILFSSFRYSVGYYKVSRVWSSRKSFPIERTWITLLVSFGCFEVSIRESLFISQSSQISYSKRESDSTFSQSTIADHRFIVLKQRHVTVNFLSFLRETHLALILFTLWLLSLKIVPLYCDFFSKNILIKMYLHYKESFIQRKEKLKQFKYIQTCTFRKLTEWLHHS